jgi:hypothetical protein
MEDLSKLWTHEHPFSYGNIKCVPEHVDKVRVADSQFLLVRCPDQIMAFLMNPDNSPPVVEDQHAELKELGIEVDADLQVPTGIEAKTCLVLQITPRDLIAKVRFLKTESYCKLRSSKGCSPLDFLLYLSFVLLDSLSFPAHGTVILDDDMHKAGTYVPLYRARHKMARLSKYMDYGFQIGPAGRTSKCAALLASIKRDPAVLEDIRETNALKHCLTGMVHPDYQKTLREMRKHCSARNPRRRSRSRSTRTRK